MRTTSLAAGIALLVAFAPVSAVAQQPQRVRGTIESVDGAMLAVKSRDGAMLKVKLDDNAVVRTVVKKTLADVKQGLFVGITAMPQPDGTQKAVEIHIFPEALRGTGEGHQPWDLMPKSTMTNANIENEVKSSDGDVLVLKYKDGEKKFIVPADTEIVMFAPGSAADLKPGEKIFIFGAKKLPDGTLDARGVTVGRDGVNPPM